MRGRREGLMVVRIDHDGCCSCCFFWSVLWGLFLGFLFSFSSRKGRLRLMDVVVVLVVAFEWWWFVLHVFVLDSHFAVCMCCDEWGVWAKGNERSQAWSLIQE